MHMMRWLLTLRRRLWQQWALRALFVPSRSHWSISNWRHCLQNRRVQLEA